MITQFLETETDFLQQWGANYLDKIYQIEPIILGGKAQNADIISLFPWCLDEYSLIPRKDVLSNYKFFDFLNNPVGHEAVDNGLHALRVWVSWWIHRWRYEVKADSNGFLVNGIRVIENAAPENVREKIAHEIDWIAEDWSKKQHNLLLNNQRQCLATYSWATSIGDDGLKPQVHKFTGMIGFNEHEFMEKTFFQRVINTPDDNDVNKVPHSDTFYPSLRYWYFPEDVDEGCFLYAPGSTNMTYQLLKWHYEQSKRAVRNDFEPWRSYGHYEGSLRISEDELKSLGLKMERYPVKAGTLIMSNQLGFHCRENAKSDYLERVALHGSLRPNDVLTLKY